MAIFLDELVEENNKFYQNLGIDEDFLNMRIYNDNMQGDMSFCKINGGGVHIALSQGENQAGAFRLTEKPYLDSHAPLLSVIVPVYNVEPYLEECLDSILAQTYPHLDIILINDGSTDNSGIICDQYKEKDSRIRVFHTDNGGQARARNMGLREARGEFVSFIDSDDWIELDMYEKAVREFLFDSQLSIVRFGYQKCYADGTVEPDICKRLSITISGKDIVETYATPEGINGVMCSSVYKSDLFEQGDFGYLEGVIHEDEILSLSLALKLSQLPSKAIKILQDIKYHYRRDIISTVSTITVRHMRDLCRGLEHVCFYAEGLPKNIIRCFFSKLLIILGYYVGLWFSSGISLKEISSATEKIRARIHPQSIPMTQEQWLWRALRFSPRLYYCVERLYAPIARRLGISSRFK